MFMTVCYILNNLVEVQKFNSVQWVELGAKGQWNS